MNPVTLVDITDALQAVAGSRNALLAAGVPAEAVINALLTHALNDMAAAGLTPQQSRALVESAIRDTHWRNHD
ncbi:MAG: hypothetical protein U5P41_07375 [Gammaproteobacteria bacterium]|nr:hypothetical protein [Gammaproteobacteria bacterium]